MHLNYFLLKGLAKELNGILSHAVITAAFSQQKEELILEFYTTSGKQFFIQAHLQPSFTCLAFPAHFHRARRNTIDLFQEMMGMRVLGVEVPALDRMMSMQLTEGYRLIFKLHGNKSNLILLKDQAVIRLFRNQLKADQEFHMPVNEAFINWSLPSTEAELMSNLPFAHAQIKSFLKSNRADFPLDEGLWSSIVEALDSPVAYVLVQETIPVFTLLPATSQFRKFDSLVEGLSYFFRRFQYSRLISGQKAELLRLLQRKKALLIDQLQQSNHRLQQLEQEQPKSQWADLLMAYMHELVPGQTELKVYDFYREQELSLKIKQGLSPQQQAERWYKASQNRHLEVTELRSAIARRQQQLARVNELLGLLPGLTETDQLKQLLVEYKPISATEGIDQVNFREEECMGFLIWVGKNENQNELLLKLAHKDDLWMHARDVAGSHVLVRRKPGQPYPKPVIERAAALAAWYSKRRTDSLCPVMYTARKYVRKIKGAAPGLVRVDREQVLMVRPAS